MTSVTSVIRIFSEQYNTFLDELIRLHPYKFELQLLKAYPCSHETILEEGSKHLTEQVEQIILNRDVDGLVSLVPENYRPLAYQIVNDDIWKWISFFVKIIKKYTIIKEGTS